MAIVFETMYVVAFVTAEDTYYIERDHAEYDEVYHWTWTTSDKFTPHPMEYNEIIEVIQKPTKYNSFPTDITGTFQVFALEPKEVSVATVTEDVTKRIREQALAKLSDQEKQALGLDSSLGE